MDFPPLIPSTGGKIAYRANLSPPHRGGLRGGELLNVFVFQFFLQPLEMLADLRRQHL